ncbi:hypothetical protein FRC01_004834 [Tulasnella sp. 417]|nr:hypothetical protein FRC01_004834 [Tulasnella sp. 417]
MSSFAELQGLHSQSLLGTTPHGSGTFDAASIFGFHFGSAASHPGDDLNAGGGPPESGGVPPLLLSSMEETRLPGLLDKFSGDGFEFGPEGCLNTRSTSIHQQEGSVSPGYREEPAQIIMGGWAWKFILCRCTNPTSSIFFFHPRPTRIFSRRSRPITTPPKRRKSSVTDSSSRDVDAPPPTPSAFNSKAARKTLLTEPQKRWNHIQSEQRRRTAIKENFSTPETLVAADKRYKGPHPTLPVPLDANGKPRKGVKAKSLRGKGKMGTLFRAAEFIAYLEEGVGALSLEVERLEAAAAMYQQQQQQQHQMQMQGQNAMAGVVHYPLR